MVSPAGMLRKRAVNAVPESSSRPRRLCPRPAGLYQIAEVSRIRRDHGASGHRGLITEEVRILVPG